MPQLEILLQQFAKTSPPLITASFLIYFNILISRKKIIRVFNEENYHDILHAR